MMPICFGGGRCGGGGGPGLFVLDGALRLCARETKKLQSRQILEQQEKKIPFVRTLFGIFFSVPYV
jgi:hypothetical protein